jgi:diguanylate cyclase (GGDEF)-like protein/PAS domain S-box-containing protein
LGTVVSGVSSSLPRAQEFGASFRRLFEAHLLGMGIVGALILYALQFALIEFEYGTPEIWTSWLVVLACATGVALVLAQRHGLAGAWPGRAACGGSAFVMLGIIHGISMASVAGWQWSPGWAAGALAVAGVVGVTIGVCGPALLTPIGAAGGGIASLAGIGLMHALTIRALGGIVYWSAVVAPLAGVLFATLALLVGIKLELHGLLLGRSRIDRFRILADALPIPIVLTSADGEKVIFANELSRRQLLASEGHGGAAGIGRLYTNPEESKHLGEMVRRDGEVEGHIVEMRRTDGTTFWALSSARSIAFDGRPAILSGFVDITDRKMAEEALLASEVRYALISRAANDGIWDWDIPSDTVYYSARWKEIVGAEPGKRLSTLEDWFSRVHPDDLPALKEAVDEHIAGRTAQLDVEYRIRHGDGRICWMQSRGIALRRKDGSAIRMAGSQADITLRKTYEINLRNAAYEDRLTGLNNRAYFTHLVDTRVGEESIKGSAILLFNIDQFRRVNDALGTGSGDALLIAFARRLASWVKPQDALCRLGADEFGVWLTDIQDYQAAMQLANSILADLSQPYTLGEAQLPVTISAGLAAASIGGARSGADLLHNSRLALDRSKQMGEGRCVLFDEQLLKETKLRQRLSRELANAGRLDQIFLEYQPVVALSGSGSDRVAGFEALMRWRHPDLGLIPPGQFVPLAEEAGLIGSLGMLAIEHAAREIAHWTDEGLATGNFSVAVNLSARQISDAAGVQRLYSLLDRLTVPVGRLKLEITESVLMSDPDEMARTFRELRDRGIELSLDDFGTGYSSLSYLHRFPLNVLKVDRSFVTRMLRSPEALRLVRSIIDLGHDLGLAVVAEGVEEADEVECLRELGCDYCQGYFYSRPVPASQAKLILAKGTISAHG